MSNKDTVWFNYKDENGKKVSIHIPNLYNRLDEMGKKIFRRGNIEEVLREDYKFKIEKLPDNELKKHYKGLLEKLDSKMEKEDLELDFSEAEWKINPKKDLGGELSVREGNGNLGAGTDKSLADSKLPELICPFCGRKLIRYKEAWICGHGCTKPAIKPREKTEIEPRKFPDDWIPLPLHYQLMRYLIEDFLKSFNWVLERIEFHTENSDSELIEEVSEEYKKWEEKQNEREY